MSGVINGIMTALGLITFIGIVWWAFSAGRAKDNKAASELPFLVPDEEPTDENKEANNE